MSDQSAHEPTMEEILASIRRIISEDDAPEEAGEPAQAATPAPEPEPEPDFEIEPEAAPVLEVGDEPEDDVLELTEPYVAAPVASIGDLDAYEPVAAAAPQYRPEPKPAYAAPQADFGAGRLVSDRTESTAANAFGALTNALLVPKDGRTLEDVLKELMRPMLQDWLDKNLAAIVEEQVRSEVERIARQARR